ncbi:uncharacterized protein SAPINGB_P001425 [Magnusiomyces paraingens]|uniref:Aminopeptidase n=1 Tax=Magnusiomyces paraingens TaxID=2606893 RepID=A0A5E8B5V3_9ASCO|nr:uncharacterized protein SAPINGB_P001425 [Saprochaete ingens]VVT46863.1 unnamed protein product [Saprochaete ingens]
MSSQDRDVLPKGLKPVNYNLKIYEIDTEALTFNGTVVIHYAVTAPTSAVYLNARDLTIKDATVATFSTKTESVIDVTSISYDKPTEVVTLELATPIGEAVSKVLVTVNYSGIIQTNMAGFYRSKYKEASSGKDTLMLSTQFEATDARRAFPCADEPNLKATFDLSIAVPETWTAISNMPIVSSQTPGSGKKSGEDGSNTKIVTFDTTPVMSTYLLAWATGDFEYIEAFTEKSYNGRKLPVRVYTTKGLSSQGQLALESAAKIVDYFSEIFDIDYALPKVDLLAVHEFSHGAMENWGLITYRTTAVLYDEETSDAAYKTRVVYVVAHELAHQWFGNLVTMDWWNELWLNEGFATYVGWLAVDHLYPDWQVFSRFITEALQGAFGLDSLRQSHPIEVPVKSALDIDQIFDSISYLKGASTIRMLSNQLGTQTFLKGVSNYLKKHAYGNAHTIDLWSSLSDVSGIDVDAAMKNWTGKIGFPVITVVVNKDTGDVTLQQDRFLRGGDVKPEENETVWWVPLSLSSGAEADATITSSSGTTLETKDLVLLGLANEVDFFLLNKNQTNVYRVNYSAEQLTNIASNIEKLSLNDRIGVVADAASLAIAGSGSTSGLLSLILALKKDTSFEVWSEILKRLGALRSVWFEQDEESQKGLAALTRDVLSYNLEQLGWEFAKDEGYRTGRLRTLIIGSSVKVGVESVISEAKTRFAKWKTGDKSAIHPSLRHAVFTAVLKYTTGSELTEAYDAIFQEVVKPSSVDSAEIALSSLGSVTDAALIDRGLNYILSDEVPSQDTHSIGGSLAANVVARWKSWEYLKANWDAIYKKFSTNMVVLDRLVRLMITNFASEKAYKEIETFYSDKNTHGFERSLGQALDTIKANTEWVERDGKEVKQWLVENKYI